MDLETIRALLKLMEEHDLAEVEVESENETIRLRKRESQATPNLVTYAPQQSPAPQSPAAPQPSAPPASPTAKALVEIHSPMVGTFYSKPNPESPPYVDIGEAVDPNSVVCIVEAMKVMNEIRAETSGRIVEILVNDGDPVEFGQPLFRVEPAP